MSINTQKARGNMSVRVAIGLSLHGVKNGKISSKMRLVSDEGVIQKSAIAHAEVIHLKNVKPIIHSDILSKVQSGERGPSQCAFLSGELVAWQGEYGEYLPEEWKVDVEPLRVESMFNQASGYKSKIKKALLNQNNLSVNFRTSYNVFYSSRLSGNGSKKAFEGAEELVACWWKYVAIGAQTRELSSEDFSNKSVVEYKAMMDKIKAGCLQTQKKIAELVM